MRQGSLCSSRNPAKKNPYLQLYCQNDQTIFMSNFSLTFDFYFNQLCHFINEVTLVLKQNGSDRYLFLGKEILQPLLSLSIKTSTIFCFVQPKKIFKNVPFLRKLEVKHIEVMAGRGKTCSFCRFCNEMTTDGCRGADCCSCSGQA